MTLVQKPGPNSACVFLDLLVIHRSHGSPSFELFNHESPLDHSHPPSISFFYYRMPGPTFVFLEFINLFFPTAHVVVILIIGHSDFNKTLFSVLNCSAFFSSSSLSKRVDCLLCFRLSCIFNDLQGKDFFLSFFL